MGLFSFIKEAGKKIFGSKEDAKKEQPELTDEQIQQQQADALKKYITDYNIDINNLAITFTAEDEVTITGEAATKEDYEKVGLITGNVLGISKVDNQITFAGDDVADSQTHTVEKGDTLWAISAKYYGNGAKYTTIVEANQPMITNPDMIYPGQVLRIPNID